MKSLIAIHVSVCKQLHPQQHARKQDAMGWKQAVYMIMNRHTHTQIRIMCIIYAIYACHSNNLSTPEEIETYLQDDIDCYREITVPISAETTNCVHSIVFPQIGKLLGFLLQV